MQKKMGDWIVCAYVAAHHVDIFFAMMSTKQFPTTFGSKSDSYGFIVRWSFIPDKVSTSFPSTFMAIRPESHNVTLHSGVGLSSLQF